jgi:hypothetical protein
VTSHKERRELESWGWSLGYALLAGAEKYFSMASGDLEALFEGIGTRSITGVRLQDSRARKSKVTSF